MTYYFTTTLKSIAFSDAILKVKEALKKESFGVLTEIDMKSTFKSKLDIDFHNYTILGACNPPFAFKALQAEDKIGTMLPCNIIVQEKTSGIIEIAAIDPAASMVAVDSPALKEIAVTVRESLRRVILNLT